LSTRPQRNACFQTTSSFIQTFTSFSTPSAHRFQNNVDKAVITVNTSAHSPVRSVSNTAKSSGRGQMHSDSRSSHHWVCYFRTYTVGPGSDSTASDEILNGKTHDKNSYFFAQYCFERGIELCVLFFNSIHTRDRLCPGAESRSFQTLKKRCASYLA